MLDFNLVMPKNGGMDVIKDLGPTALARMVGVKPPSVMEWSKRGIPVDRCPVIERETAGQYPCEQTRPDVAWHRVPDAQWPWHVGGRPMIDVTAKAAA
jgi:hypothetical protein